MREQLEQTVDVETPEQVVFSYTVAGVGSRAAAALIDHGIIIGALFGITLFLVFVVWPAFGGGNAPAPARDAGGWVVALVVLVQFVVVWGYYVLFEGLWDGQTPGKRMLRLRVVQDGGYSVTFGASAARNVARVLDMQPAPVYLVGLVAVAASKTGKRVGDHLAGTFVVRERVVPLGVERPLDEAVRGARALEATLTEEELDVLARFVARADALDPERRDAFAAQLAGRLLRSGTEPADRLSALRELLSQEREARARGAGGRGEKGAARERYAILAEGESRWRAFATKLADAQRRGLRHMSGEEVAEFAADYREVAADLARLSTAVRDRDSGERFRLSRLVAGGHNLLYRQERLAVDAVKRFLFVAVPAELRRSLLPIVGAAALLLGSGAAAWVGVIRDPRLIAELVSPGMIDRAEVDAARAAAGDARYIDIEDYHRPILASRVVSNNVQVAFAAFASGLTAGVFTVLVLLINGLHIGSAIGLFHSKGVGMLIIDFVIAHSAFELTAICIAAGAGFVIAGGLLLPGAVTRREALTLRGRRALRLLAAATLFLVVAGAIEGLISPRHDIPFAAKAGVAGLSLLLIVVYFGIGTDGHEHEHVHEWEAGDQRAARALMAR